MIRTYIINLDKDVDRWGLIQDHLLPNDYLDIERVSATDGDNVPSEELSRMCDMFCSRGMKGCFASHKGAWKRIIDENLPYALILEDDIIAIPTYKEDISNALENVPNDFDVLTFYDSGYETRKGIFDEIITRGMGIYNPKHQVLNEYIQIPMATMSCTGYIVSNKGAKKLLSIFPNITYHVDYAMFHNHDKLGLYTTTKGIFKQQEHGESNTRSGGLQIPYSDVKIAGNTTLGAVFDTVIFQVGSIQVTWLYVLILMVLIVVFTRNKKGVLIAMSIGLFAFLAPRIMISHN